jgi:hypothetical protein
MTDEQLIELIKRDQHFDLWKSLEELLNRKIEKARDGLEKSQDQESTIRLQTRIKTLRGLLTFDIK